MKRLFDIIFSFVELLIILPVFLFISVLIKLEDSGPVFYRGIRVGRYGKLLRMFKFRTMVVNADKIGGFSCADDDPRITKFGKFLRIPFLYFPIRSLFPFLVGQMAVVLQKNG